MSHPLFTLPANSGWTMAGDQDVKPLNWGPTSYPPTVPLTPAPAYEHQQSFGYVQPAYLQRSQSQQAAHSALAQQQMLQQQLLQLQMQQPQMDLRRRRQMRADHFDDEEEEEEEEEEQQLLRNRRSAHVRTRTVRPSRQTASPQGEDDGVYNFEAVVNSYGKCVTCPLSKGESGFCPRELTQVGLRSSTYARIVERTREVKDKSDTNKVLLHTLGICLLGLIFNVLVAKHCVGNTPLRHQLAVILERENAQLAHEGTPVRFVWRNGALCSFQCHEVTEIDSKPDGVKS